MKEIFNNTLLNHNLEILKKRNISLYGRLKNFISSGKYCLPIINCRNNGYTYSIKTDNEDALYIHSQYDSIKEAERFIGQFQFSKSDLLIAVYPGLGYHLNILFKRGDCPNILIIARELNELTAMLQVIELPVNSSGWHLADSENLNSIISEFNSAFNILFLNNIKYLLLPVIHRAYEKKINEIMALCSKSLDNSIAQAATLSNFGEIFQSNVINNFKICCHAPGVNVLKNKFAGFPAIIVSAGPSLDFNIEKLKKFKDKFIIIAVDTVYGKLIQNDIIPHFTVTIDPQNKSYYHFKNFKQSGFFISCMIASSKVLESINQNCFFFVSDYPLAMFLEGLSEKKGHFSTGGGSVATVALQFADYIGANYVVFIGQDLSYPVLKTHCDSTAYSDILKTALNKFNTHETAAIDSMSNKISTRGIRQPEVYTTHQLLEYLRWITEYVNSGNTKKYFNCTYDGAYIEGIEHLELEEFVVIKELKNLNIDFNELKSFFKNNKRVDGNSKISELRWQLLRLKDICRINRFRLNTFNDLNVFMNENAGLFELIKTLVFSKAVKKMRNNIEADERKKISILISIIFEALDYTLNLLDEKS